MAERKKAPKKVVGMEKVPKKAKLGKGALLTKPLGLEGWDHLETVLLAAVISETPLLLVGPHGCAKSFFLEKLAQALGLEYRFYNTSLINYDDLVGIPIPSSDRKSLEYISIPSSIWDAEVVFMDEINRTRPDLQNKIFPIIHERRVQGVPLEKLRFRWAAMNPPAVDAVSDEVCYLGADPLDTALADRFGFIVEVPAWKNLNQEQRRAVLADQFSGDHPFPIALDSLLEQARARLEALQKERHYDIEDYLIMVSEELVKAGVVLSTRRMTMLYANILAVHAAAETLDALKEKKTAYADWSASAWTALQHSLPQMAEGSAPEPVKLRTAHLQAWKLMQTSADTAERVLLSIADPVERALEAVRRSKTLPQEVLGNAVINLLSGAAEEAERGARSLAFYLATHTALTLPNTALAALHETLSGILTPRTDYIEVEDHHKEFLVALTDKTKEIENEEERVVEHYAMNLAEWVFEQTRRIPDSKRSQKRFKELHRQFNKALAA